MKIHIILSVFLFNVIFAMKKPLDHQFLSRNHDGKKTIVTDGVKTKVSVSKVFWSMIEGDYIYGKKTRYWQKRKRILQVIIKML